jgi:hypothetical protein
MVALLLCPLTAAWPARVRCEAAPGALFAAGGIVLLAAQVPHEAHHHPDHRVYHQL